MLLEESVYDSFLTYHLLSCRNSITHLSNWTETCPVSGVPYPLLPIGVIRSYTHHPHGQCFRCLYYYFKELLQIYKSFFKLPNIFRIFFLKSGWQDLNLRPPAPKAGALPTAPHPDKSNINTLIYISTDYPSLIYLVWFNYLTTLVFQNKTSGKRGYYGNPFLHFQKFAHILHLLRIQKYYL